MIVHESVGFEALEFIPMADSLSFPLMPAGWLYNPDDDPFLGKSIFTRIGKRIQKTVKKIGKPVMKVVKKNFVKFAPILAVAAQVLNVIPGLGVAVGAAIAIGGQVMKMKQEQKAFKAATKEEETAMAVEQVAADKEANTYLDDAYTQGESYFMSMGMPRDKWTALTIEGKTTFLNDTVYTANEAKFTAAGITKEKFRTMTEAERGAIVTAAEQEEAAAAGVGVGEGEFPWMWVGIGVGGVLVVLTALYLLTRESEPIRIPQVAPV